MLPPLSPVPVELRAGDLVFAANGGGYAPADHPDTPLKDVAPVRYHENSATPLQRFPSIWDHSMIPGSLGDPIWTENAVDSFWRMFLSANRIPPSGQARGHASPEHALAHASLHFTPRLR